MRNNQEVLDLIASLYRDLFRHEGYGELRVEMRLLKRGQKEVIVHCGKQYRFVVNYRGPAEQTVCPADGSSISGCEV